MKIKIYQKSQKNQRVLRMKIEVKIMPREDLGINDQLELIKEDKNLNGAYISIAQYIYLIEKENQELKKDIKNIIRILNKNCDELETTEEEFESLKRWNK